MDVRGKKRKRKKKAAPTLPNLAEREQIEKKIFITTVAR